ncbi:MAG: hypothetical protein HN623_01160, partial [Bdellovibrionales bacterium]|nr:hypothetical protein [Bdellovibrionales bacterium]
ALPDCHTLFSELTELGEEITTNLNRLKDQASQIISDPPTLQIEGALTWTNQSSLKITIENKSNLTKSESILSHLDSIDLQLLVADMPISIGQVRSSNSADGHLPGPNLERVVGKSNTLRLKIDHSAETIQLVGRVDGTEISISGLLGQVKPWATISSNAAAYEGDSTFINQRYDPDNPLRNESKTNIPSLAVRDQWDQECGALSAAGDKVIDWDISFTKHSPFSWMFSALSPNIDVSNLNWNPPHLDDRDGDGDMNNDPSDFFYFCDYTITNQSQVADDQLECVKGKMITRSIMNNCVVKSTTDLVFGDYVCVNLIVEPRDTPIYFIGTMVVNNISIDPTATDQGVYFYSLWDSQAIELLKQHPSLGINGSGCNNRSKVPWSTTISDGERQRQLACSPLQFTNINNFNWTTIDPEIGIAPESINPTDTQSKVQERFRRFRSAILGIKEARL